MKATDLSPILQSLKEAALVPANIEHSIVGDFHMINYWNSLNSEIICESVQCGMSKNLGTALAKCTSEYIERLASRENYDKHHNKTDIRRTDGYACYPNSIESTEDSLDRTRENALSEATERYSWATWWDDESIAFKLEELNLASLGFEKTESLLKSFLNVSKIQKITPLTNSPKETISLLLETTQGGYLTGGACGPNDSIESTERALAELTRHCLAYKKLLSNGLKSDSFYSERLSFFASGRGRKIVRKRLEAKGTSSIELPPLVIDELVPHSMEHSFHVYRCLFADQPFFVGGDLERLCL